MKRLIPFLFAVLSMASGAQTPVSVALGALFVEDTIRGGAEVCKKRYPDSQSAWSLAFETWRRRNQANLDKLRELADQVEKRYEEQATRPFGELPSPFAALYLQSVALPLSALAATNDNEARAVCDGLQAALSSGQLETLKMNEVTEAAESILASPAPLGRGSK